MFPSCSAAQHLHHDVDLTLRLQDFMILSCVVHCVSKALHVEESQSAAKERQSYLSLYLLRSSVATLEPELYLHVDGRCNLRCHALLDMSAHSRLEKLNHYQYDAASCML